MRQQGVGEAKGLVCLVFRCQHPSGSRMAHVGLSLGDGWVVDARSHARGVIKTRLLDYPWTHLALPRGFPLPESLTPREDQNREVTLTPGQIRQAQQALLDLGFPLPRYGADGILGAETKGAIRAFQHCLGLPLTGNLDGDTLKKLLEASRL